MDKDNLNKNTKDASSSGLLTDKDSSGTSHKTAPPPSNLPGTEDKEAIKPDSSGVVSSEPRKITKLVEKIVPDDIPKKIPIPIPTPVSKDTKSEVLKKQPTVIDKTTISIKEVSKKPSTKKTVLPITKKIEKKTLITPEVSVSKFDKTKEGAKSKKYIIRTYQSDIAKALKDNKGSVTKIAVAEQIKKQETQEGLVKDNKTKKISLWVSLTLIIVGIMALSFIILSSSEEEKITGELKNLQTKEIVFSEILREINTTGLNKEKLVKSISDEIKNSDFRLDQIKNIIFTRERFNEEGFIVKSLLPTRDFFTLVTDRLPPSLIRSFYRDYMFGIHSFNGNTPFIIVEIDFFDNAFAGMLRWEDFMADDMFPLFAIEGVDKSIREKKFKDLVFRNQDIRILTDAQDQILLVYSFPDRQTLIITTDIETFDEIINRLNTPKPLSQ